MLKVKNKFIMNNLPELIFSGLFLFTYLPHFIYCWVPQLLDDSFAYLLIAKDFYDNQIPLKGHVMDLPYGYGFFISTIFKLGGTIRTVTLIQTIVCGISFILLVNSLKLVSYKVSLISTVVLWLHCSNSQSLLWNSLIYNESFYISSLILTTVLSIRIFYNQKTLDIYLLAFCFLISIYLRTNGIYLLFIPVILFLFFYFVDKSKIKHVFVAYIFVLLFNSTTNYFVKDYFAPSEIKRHISKFKGEVEYYENSKLQGDKKVFTFSDYPKKYIIEQSFELFTHIQNTKFGNHFYFRMHNQSKDFYPDSLLNKINVLHSIVKYRFDDRVTDIELRNFTQMNINWDKLNLNEKVKNTDISLKPRNIWLISNHLLELGVIIYRNWLILILFYLVLFYNILSFIKFRQIYSQSFLILFISLIHLLSLTLFSISVVSDNALPRYAFVSEFIVYIVVILGLNNFILLKKQTL